MAKRLPKSFYDRDTVTVARELLGKCLVRRQGGRRLVGVVTEAEAYCGPNDRACHASKGRTARTEVMFGPPGHWYVYLIYGMHHCLNIVTEGVGSGSAVLIRGVDPLGGFAEPPPSADGPGKLCRAFGIDKSFYGARAYGRNAPLWFEDHGICAPEQAVQITKRIGVDYAGACAARPWRFVAVPSSLAYPPRLAPDSRQPG